MTILAGFLGAGKTTLLNRILSGDHGRRVAVFVNDFGALPIDSQLIARRDADVIALDNGCICCTIGADLVSQLVSLLEGPSRPEHVLVECSGVSDPGRLLVALQDAHLRTLAHVDGVVTLLDAAAADAIPPAHLELARRQLACADVIVLNKVDLVSDEELTGVRARFTYPGAWVLEAVYGDVPLEVVLGLERADDRAAGGVRRADAHTGALTTWTWESDVPVRGNHLRRVLRSLPAGVFRAKGFVELAELPGRRVAVHLVARRLSLEPCGDWNGAPPRSALVFISLDPNVQPSLVAAKLDGAARRAA